MLGFAVFVIWVLVSNFWQFCLCLWLSLFDIIWLSCKPDKPDRTRSPKPINRPTRSDHLNRWSTGWNFANPTLLSRIENYPQTRPVPTPYYTTSCELNTPFKCLAPSLFLLLCYLCINQVPSPCCSTLVHKKPFETVPTHSGWDKVFHMYHALYELLPLRWWSFFRYFVVVPIHLMDINDLSYIENFSFKLKFLLPLHLELRVDNLMYLFIFDNSIYRWGWEIWTLTFLIKNLDYELRGDI